jgi:hypothetical protein
MIKAEIAIIPYISSRIFDCATVPGDAPDKINSSSALPGRIPKNCRNLFAKVHFIFFEVR